MKAEPPTRNELWLGAEQSGRRARGPGGGSSLTLEDGAHSFLRTHWARELEIHLLPCAGHAFAGGRCGVEPGRQAQS